MATKRIYQIAKDFECDEKKIIEFLTGQGIKVANRLSAVSEDTYNLLKAKFLAPPPPPEPEPEPEPAPKVEEPAQVAQPAPPPEGAPAQGGGKKKKKKKKSPQAAQQPATDENSDSEDEVTVSVDLDAVHAATQAVCGEALVASNEFLKKYVSASKRKKKKNSTSPYFGLSRNTDSWALIQDLNFDYPDASPMRYYQAVNKLTTKAFKLMQNYGLSNREILGEMRDNLKSVGAKYEPQEIFTNEENQRFEFQQRFLFNRFGHGMGAVNDNLYALKMHAERMKASFEQMDFVGYITGHTNIEVKPQVPFDTLVDMILYSIRSVPVHVDFYKEYKDYILKAVENFFEWIESYKKLKEQGADAAKLEKYLYLEEKFFKLIDFMSFDNLVSVKKQKFPIPFLLMLDLLREYRDNMDDPDAERNFKYKVRGVTNFTYKPKEYVFLFQLAELEPQKDYRPPEVIAAAEATAEQENSPAEESDEA